MPEAVKRHCCRVPKSQEDVMQSGSHGSFYWNELMSHDAEKAKKFYADTLGWTYEAMQMPPGTYWIIKADGQSAGGIFPMQGPEFAQVPEHWVAYVAVDDVDARLKKAKAAGATAIREPFDVPGVGRIAILHDPGGAVMGWITPKRA
jgi:predicted enzyme related to lactoylglutathione lyase